MTAADTEESGAKQLALSLHYRLLFSLSQTESFAEPGVASKVWLCLRFAISRFLSTFYLIPINIVVNPIGRKCCCFCCRYWWLWWCTDSSQRIIKVVEQIVKTCCGHVCVRADAIITNRRQDRWTEEPCSLSVSLARFACLAECNLYRSWFFSSSKQSDCLHLTCSRSVNMRSRLGYS